MEKSNASPLNSEDRQYIAEVLKQLDALKRKLVGLLDRNR